jgi:hypothetical protein
MGVAALGLDVEGVEVDKVTVSERRFDGDLSQAVCEWDPGHSNGSHRHRHSKIISTRYVFL